jgi:protein Tex
LGRVLKAYYFAPSNQQQMDINHFIKIAEELGIKVKQVTDTVELLDGGATVPFISRYRKEVTGKLG